MITFKNTKMTVLQRLKYTQNKMLEREKQNILQEQMTYAFGEKEKRET